MKRGYDEELPAFPLVVWQAQPSRIYEIIPVRKFYITTGDSKVGTVVNMRAMGTKCEIDFTESNLQAKGKNEAIVEFDSNYGYSKLVYK